MKRENRNAKAVVWVVAAGFLVVGGMNLTVDWLKHQRQHEAMGLWRVFFLSIPLVVGAVILIKSRALARQIEEYLDE